MQFIVGIVYYVVMGVLLCVMVSAMAMAWLLDILVGPYTLISGDYPDGWP